MMGCPKKAVDCWFAGTPDLLDSDASKKIPAVTKILAAATTHTNSMVCKFLFPKLQSEAVPGGNFVEMLKKHET